MDIWRTLEVLFKRKWIILGSGLVALALLYFATRDMKSVWSAKVTLMAPPPAVNASALGKTGENAVSDPGDPDERGALYEALLKSSRVLEPALKEAGMTPDIADLLDNISIEGGKSGLYTLEVRGAERVSVEKLANALGLSLQNQGTHLFTDRVDSAIHLLENELRSSNQELAAIRARYEAQRRLYGVVERLEDHLGPALGRLESARAAREEAAARLSELNARATEKQRLLENLPARIPGPISEPSPLIKKLEEELADAERGLTVLQARYTDDVGAVKVARASRDALQSRLKQEQAADTSAPPDIANPARERAEQELAVITEDRAGTLAQLAKHESELAAARAEVAGYAGAGGPLASLADELARSGERRASLEARLRVAQISRDAMDRQSPLVVLERVNRFNPTVNLTAGKKMRLVLVAVVATLVLAAGAAIALDALDRRLRTLPQAELLLPGPVLAAVPQAAGPVKRSHLGSVAKSFPLSPHAEAYHFLASHLDSERGSGSMVLMLTASRSGMGSARTATNLAISLAQAGRRVILADFNLRRPVLHEFLDQPNGSGISELLCSSGLEDLQLYLQPGPYEGLSLLTAGSHCGSPWELLHSKALPGLFRALRSEAEFVIVDTPSALAFSDAQELAPHVDVALLCIRAQETTTGSEDRVVRSLERLGARFLGTALYDVPVTALESYRSHLYCMEPVLCRDSARPR